MQTPTTTKPSWRFLLKFFSYVVPFALPFLILTGGLFFLGESMPLSMVLQQQSGEEPVLYRPRYGNRDQQLKLLAVNTRQPEVLAIGSSRVLQFRREFLDLNPDAFYNAAAPAWRLEQVHELIFSIDESALPRIILLGIDPPWFNSAYTGDQFPAPVNDYAQFFLANRSFLQDLIGGASFDRPGFELASYAERHDPGPADGLALGLRAIRDGHGFRDDGSEQFGDFLVAGWLSQGQQRDSHMEMMRRGEGVYPYGDSLDAERLAMLDEILAYARQKNILVIGFLPSYLPRLWQEMQQMPEHAYIVELTPVLRERFAAYDAPFFDFSDGAWLGAAEEDFFDGWHASERANLALYLALLRETPALQAYSDSQALLRIHDGAADTWFVFGS